MSTAFATAPTQGADGVRPWDEMANGRGGLRAGWSSLLASVAGLGPEGLARRADLLDRMLAEDGVTGLLPGVQPNAWRCDPLPLLLGAGEFEVLEAGLAQRARLIDAVLRDIYGKQTLLADGLVPPALVYANPAYLRPCCDAEGASIQRLHVYAAEVLRAPDGTWRVLADRTADAAGIAYVLENRRALYRAVPELFRSHAPRGLGAFFDAWQDTLQRLAPPGIEHPGMALLTPGADDKLWFEHVVLARELSCTLVESSDLTVRDGALFLKTLRGLRRVHVLVRRQDGRTLDPLELEPTGRLGITGLLDAARSGSVRIVNDPGTGCIEAPMWTAVLPRLARRLIHEEPILRSIETEWLGDPDAYARVRPALSDWRIRHALDGKSPSLPRPQEPAALDELRARIDAAPGDYIASKPLPPSLAPCLTPDGLQPLPVVLRMFMMFDGERWRAMPGGFARIVSQQDLDSGRLPLHAVCKDVWVAHEEEEDIIGPPMTQPMSVPVRRMAGELPSRVADNFFWLGRTLEGLEGSARLLRTALERLERPNPSPRETAELRSVVACLALNNLVEREAVSFFGGPALTERLFQIGRARAALPEQVAEISRLTEVLRDRLTREVHSTFVSGLRTLSQSLASLRPTEGKTPPSMRDLQHLSTTILGFAATVAGLAAENMVRSGGRLFLDLGRRVERAWATSRNIAEALDFSANAGQPGPLEPGLRLALELCDSVITYRSRYLTALQPGPVLDLVLSDEGNPRALAFQIASIRDILAELARAPGAALPLQASTLLREAREIARSAALAPERQLAVTLPAQLRAVERGVTALSAQISRQYFAILPMAHRVDADEEQPSPSGGGEGAPLRGMA